MSTEDVWIRGVYYAKPITTEPPEEIRDLIIDVMRESFTDSEEKRDLTVQYLNHVMHAKIPGYINNLIFEQLKYMKSIRAIVEKPDTFSQEEFDSLIKGLTVIKTRHVFDVLALLGFDLDCEISARAIVAKNGIIPRVEILAKAAELTQFIKDNYGMLKTILDIPIRRLQRPLINYGAIQIFVNSLISSLGWQLMTIGDHVKLITMDYIKWDHATQKHIRADK